LTALPPADLAAIGNAFLDAPLFEGGWDKALRMMSSATRSSRAQLVGVGEPDRLLFNVVTDQIPGAAEDLFAIGGLSRDVNWRASIDGPPLKLYHDLHYAEARARQPHADMADYFEQYEASFGSHTTLIREPDAIFTLALLRSRNDGATTSEDAAVFDAIIPYAHAAARMELALEQQGALLLSGTLENMKAAAILCDRRGRACAMTPAAEAMMASGCGLRILHDRPIAVRNDDNRLLQRALLEGLEDRVNTRLFLSEDRDGSGDDLGQPCTILSLPRREWTFGFEPAVMILLRRQELPGTADVGVVQAALGLSRAEAEVALLSARGMSRQAIAQERATSPETVKVQLRKVFRKGGLNRQAQLSVLIRKLLE
jgi:DNA-binding CsgD family transcriptional regulator